MKKELEQQLQKIKDKDIAKKILVGLMGVPVMIISTSIAMIFNNLISWSLVPAGFIFMMAWVGIGPYLVEKNSIKKLEITENKLRKEEIKELAKEEKEKLKELSKDKELFEFTQIISSFKFNEEQLDLLKRCVLNKNINNILREENRINQIMPFTDYDFNNEEKYDIEYEEMMTKRPKQKIKTKRTRE